MLRGMLGGFLLAGLLVAGVIDYTTRGPDRVCSRSVDYASK